MIFQKHIPQGVLDTISTECISLVVQYWVILGTPPFETDSIDAIPVG